MPVINETFKETCGSDWIAVAGPGRVFIANCDDESSLHWVIGGATAPTLTLGYALPPTHGVRSDTEAVIVPDGRRLWVRSGRADETTSHEVLLTVDALP